MTTVGLRHGQLPDGTTLPLFRLRYGGSAKSWGFAIHLASRGDCENAVLPNGNHEEALDCACGRYLRRPHRLDPTPDN